MRISQILYQTLKLENNNNNIETLLYFHEEKLKHVFRNGQYTLSKHRNDYGKLQHSKREMNETSLP